MSDDLPPVRLRLNQIPPWRAMPLAAVFVYPHPATLSRRQRWAMACAGGMPTHCLLYLGDDDLVFDSTPSRGVNLWPIGLETLFWKLRGAVFTVVQPSPVIRLPGDVQTVFTRAMGLRGAGYDHLRGACPWIPVSLRRQFTAADFVADSLVGIVPRILRESATPRQLEACLVRAGWEKTVY